MSFIRLKELKITNQRGSQMINKIVSQRGVFGTFVIEIFILTPFFTFLLDHRGYDPPDNYEDI